MPPIRGTPRADRASRRISFMPISTPMLKRPTNIAFLMYVLFDAFRTTTSLKTEDIYDRVARVAQETGVGLGVRAAPMLRRAILLLENRHYIEIDDNSADGRTIILTEDMLAIMTQTQDQINELEFSSNQAEFLTICSLFTQRLRKKSPTLAQVLRQVKALEKRIQELQLELRNPVTQADIEGSIDHDSHPEVESIPTDPRAPITPVRRQTSSMMVYPTPESLPRIRRSTSTCDPSPSTHPSHDNTSDMDIEEETQVHADLVLQLQGELTDSQDRNRVALAQIEELQQEIHQLINDKEAMEYDTGERQRQFALWRLRLNQELRATQETSESLQIQNKSLQRKVEEISSDMAASETRINELRGQVSGFHTFWQNYTKIEAEAREQLAKLQLPTFI